MAAQPPRGDDSRLVDLVQQKEQELVNMIVESDRAKAELAATSRKLAQTESVLEESSNRLLGLRTSFQRTVADNAELVAAVNTFEQRVAQKEIAIAGVSTEIAEMKSRLNDMKMRKQEEISRKQFEELALARSNRADEERRRQQLAEQERRFEDEHMRRRKENEERRKRMEEIRRGIESSPH